MLNERLLWRIAYSLDEFYYVVATSNNPPNETVELWAASAGGYTEQNGIASILSKSPNAKNVASSYVFVRNGNAQSAMDEMIKKLDKLYGKSCVKPIVKL